MVCPKRGRILYLICMCAFPLLALAEDFDGSKPLSGSVAKVIEINPSRITSDVDPDTVGLPRNFLIDFEERVMRPSEGSVVRKTSKITRVDHLENKLILQGIEEGVESVDDGLAWSIAISKKTGKAVLSASGDGVAYVVFGTCTPAKNYQK